MLEAARTLFLREGYAAATMEEIAELAGLTKRTVYNHYADKEALFTEVVREVIAYAEAFTRELRRDLLEMEGAEVRAALDELGPRLAVAIVRPEVVALRRLLVGEARRFPGLPAGCWRRSRRSSSGSGRRACCGSTTPGPRPSSSPTWWPGLRSITRS